MSSQPNILIKLGLIISQRRKTLGLSQEKLGELAGLHRTYISDVERGSKNLTIITFEKICQALNTTPSSIFEQLERSYR